MDASVANDEEEEAEESVDEVVRVGRVGVGRGSAEPRSTGTVDMAVNLPSLVS